MTELGAQNMSPWLIILAAGRPTSHVINVLTPQGPLFLPLGGKPVGAAILSSYHRLGIERVSIVARASDAHMISYVKQRFGALFNLDVHQVTEEFVRCAGPANSLLSVLADAGEHDLRRPLIVVFGDQLTIVDVTGVSERPILFTSDFVASSSLSYVRVRENKISEFVPKGQELSPEQSCDLFTEVGGYYFPDASAVSSGGLGRDGLQMAELIESIDIQVEARSADTWIDASRWDYGRTESVDTVAARSFNSIDIDPLRGVLTKRSEKKDKLALEVGYYRSLPFDLSIYFPRLIDSSDDSSWYSVEYYPMKTVSEYFVFWGLSVDTWTVLAGRLLQILSTFSGQPSFEDQSHSAEYFAFYWRKTTERIGEISGDVRRLVDAPVLRVNGQNLRGWSALKKQVEMKLMKLSESVSESVVHGDFCFSNILFEPTGGLVRLIDPRGSFVRPGVYGDIRYDLAKLLHSVDGMYDFVIHDMFTVSIGEVSIDFTILSDHDTREIRVIFLDHIQRAFPNIALFDVRLLEATLFLSMVPLHSDYPDRQAVFWAIGLSILNDLFQTIEDC